MKMFEVSARPKNCKHGTFATFQVREKEVFAPRVIQDMGLIQKRTPQSIRTSTSTSGSVRVIRVFVSRTAREKAREEGGERTLEHWQTGTYDCSIGLNGRPNSGVECAVHLVFSFGSSIKGGHPQDGGDANADYLSA